MQHDDNEYGADLAADGQHTGGPFFVDVSPTMRIEDLRLIIQVDVHAYMTTCRAFTRLSILTIHSMDPWTHSGLESNELCMICFGNCAATPGS